MRKSITYDKIDSTEPVVTIDSGSYRSGNWTNENVTLSVSNTASNLGTATFWYKVDKGEWQAYTDDIIVSEETDGTVSHLWPSVPAVLRVRKLPLP